MGTVWVVGVNCEHSRLKYVLPVLIQSAPSSLQLMLIITNSLLTELVTRDGIGNGWGGGGECEAIMLTEFIATCHMY